MTLTYFPQADTTRHYRPPKHLCILSEPFLIFTMSFSAATVVSFGSIADPGLLSFIFGIKLSWQESPGGWMYAFHCDI